MWKSLKISNNIPRHDITILVNYIIRCKLYNKSSDIRHFSTGAA